ncbi:MULTISPECIES: hypothetical protein [unclassified Clostridium]|uniref:hypothetical protein n=1 Tax=unclassified Clostridium TaxID=2614128 RepID=UPI001899EFAA|nr:MULTISPECIES: hypothetical protein [unclassified Clostridium]MBP3914797.1 hypothetical protein [Clostridium sp.]MEE0933594.1 hypothetical protein [Clostridium sp.]
MNKFKDSIIDDDIFIESESSNTSIVNVEDIVKSHNKNNFNNVKDSIDIERETFDQNND